MELEDIHRLLFLQAFTTKHVHHIEGDLSEWGVHYSYNHSAILSSGLRVIFAVEQFGEEGIYSHASISSSNDHEVSDTDIEEVAEVLFDKSREYPERFSTGETGVIHLFQSRENRS
jgi:hypothetical protein